jgi:hypothetical protein
MGGGCWDGAGECRWSVCVAAVNATHLGRVLLWFEHIS